MKQINQPACGTTITQFVEVINAIIDEVPNPDGSTKTTKTEVIETPTEK